MNVLHLSDLHFGDQSRDEQAKKEASDLKAKTLQKWSDSLDKPLIIVTGDVVEDGIIEQMEIAKREFFDPLRKNGFRILPVPGNHDYGRNGCHAKEKRFADFKEILIGPRSITYPDVLEPINCKNFDLILIGLNSMRAETGKYDGWLADGELGYEQLNDLGNRLEHLQKYPRDKVILVYLHHHPFLYPDDNLFERMGEYAGHYLKDGSELMNILRGRVDILLFGHEHRHIDFSKPMKKKVLTTKYDIPVILSCGKSTEPGHPAWILDINDPSRVYVNQF